jgi:hypothetical protein
MIEQHAALLQHQSSPGIDQETVDAKLCLLPYPHLGRGAKAQGKRRLDAGTDGIADEHRGGGHQGAKAQERRNGAQSQENPPCRRGPGPGKY